jgi:hypothetical protein
MEPYILFALLVIGPTEAPPGRGREVSREVTWTAEFSSEKSCEVAGSALGQKFNTTPSMQQRFVAVVDYACVKK